MALAVGAVEELATMAREEALAVVEALAAAGRGEHGSGEETGQIFYDLGFPCLYTTDK
jgi:hypothetical protein